MVTTRIENVIGSRENVLSDQALNTKYDDMALPVLGREASTRLREICWNVWDLKDAGDIGRAAKAS